MSKQSSSAGQVALLLLLTGAALALRVGFSLPDIFLEDSVRFRGTDAWYHMRLAESTVANFPHRLQYDPLLAHPGGAEVLGAPLFDQLLASLAWATGAGHPSDAWIETVGAWFPAILGSLTVVPIFFLGNLVGGRPAGLIAALLIACMPGRFLVRSLLGATDHHVLEVLLTTCCLLFFVQVEASNKSGAKGKVGAQSLDQTSWFSLPIRSALAAGLSLGLYLLSWRSGIVMIAVVLMWLVALSLLSSFRSLRLPAMLSLQNPRDTAAPVHSALHAQLPFATVVAFAVALIVVAPFVAQTGVPLTHVLFLALAILITAFLLALDRWRSKQEVSWSKVVLAWAIAISVPTILLGLLWPRGWNAIGGQLRRLTTAPWSTTVSEMRPLAMEENLLSTLWAEFTIAWILALAGAVVLTIRIVRRREPGSLLMLLWAATTLALSLAQRRFTYYLAVTVAVLAAAALSALLRRIFETTAVGVTAATGSRGTNSQSLARVTILTGILFAVVGPNLAPAMQAARTFSGPSSDWLAALEWLRRSSPDPLLGPSLSTSGTSSSPPVTATGSRSFSDTDSVSTTQQVESRDGQFPATEYGVMSWWDRGYWILRNAQRAPIANPTGHGAAAAASFFLAEDEGTATRLLRESGGRYVITDDRFPVRAASGEWATGDLASMPLWLNQSPQRYFERFEVQSADGNWSPLYLYYPSYFRTTAVHLHTFGGQATDLGNSTWEISFRQVQREDGVLVKRITRMLPVNTPDHANRLLAGLPYQEGEREGVRLASSDPTASCVPLPSLPSFHMVYPNKTIESSVRIFQFDG